MAQTKQRIFNLPQEEWTDSAREVFAYWGEPDAWEKGSRTNTMMVMANHPGLGMAYNVFGRQILVDSTLAVRPRELAVLRIAWHLKSEYEWHYHVGYALSAGVTMAEIAAVRDGPDAAAWVDKDSDAAVLRAVDELIGNSRIADTTWDALSRHFEQRQIMDLVFTIGNYVMFGWAISAFGIPIEAAVDAIGFDLVTTSGASPEASYRPGESDDWVDKSGM
ncbi:MAG TPA: carboxymuconolactone decarboxylase family protein [Sphingobium sp.]|uniref:carboxymuconolactone decarboxylase family protein n=1 Tax=Sphingobium sp. TaxID=1912891 RepID=UPI002ED68268